MTIASISSKDLEFLNDCIERIPDNNKESVLDYDSYSESDCIGLMSKSELEELKTEILDINNIDLELLEKSLKISTKKSKPKDTKNIWTKIKEKITIPDIMTLDNGRCECLQSGNPTTKNASCEYYEDTELLHCYKCDKTMDVIQVYAIIKNLEHSEAIKELVRQYNIEYGEYDENYIKTEKKIGELFQDFTEKCHENLLNSEYYEFIKNKREFTDNTMELFKIGLFDDSIKKYMNATYSKELLQNAGFIDYSKKDKEKKGKLFWKWGKRFTYPYLDRNNNPKYFIYRLIDSEPDFNKNAKYIKQIRTEYIKEIPFGLNSIHLHKKKPLLITEGITDAISIIQANYPCLSPVTTRIKKKDIKKMVSYCKRFKKVVVINDNEEFKKNKEGELDNSGLEGSITTIKALIPNKINIYIGIIPNPEELKKVDLNDYLRPKKEATTKLETLIENSVKGLDFLIDTITKKSTQDDIIEILKILPENNYLTQEDVLKILAKKRKTTLDVIKKTYKQYKDDKLLKEIKKQKGVQKQKKNEREDNKDIFERITLDNYDIEIRNEGIFKIIWKKAKEGDLYSTEIPILDGKLEVLFKIYDTILGVERFTFLLNGREYNTLTIMDTIRKFEDKIYEGTHGKDIIKKVFNHFSDKIESRKPEYILGFNNGWKLPQLEEDNDYTIIIYTDFQRDVYNRAKKIIKKYSENEKTKILKKFGELIEITQNKENFVILFAWSLSAPFRLAMLDYCDIFPHLFNVGIRLSGKNTLEKTFITNFYKIYDKMLSPNTLESISRLEDHLTESTFPHVITEIHTVQNINAIPILKDHATGTSDFERKKNAFELAFRKPKVASLSLDSNNPIRILEDPAINTKIIINEFKNQVSVEPIWKKLNRELKKEKLFSFVYDYTKDWTNKDVFQLLNKQQEKIENEFGLEKVQKLEKENPRLISIYQILLFGLELLKNIFDVEFEDGIETILNPIKLGRRYIPMELKDQLLTFCKTAIYFDEGGINEHGNYQRGINPKHLQFKLRLDEDEKYYCFTQDNLRDFKEYSGKKYRLKELNDLIADALENKENIQYVNKRFNGMMTRYIQIKADLISK